MTDERSAGIREPIRLRPYEEVCGRLDEMYQTDTHLVIGISSEVLKLPLNSVDARVCERELEDCVGASVSILRSPDSKQSLFVRVDERG